MPEWNFAPAACVTKAWLVWALAAGLVQGQSFEVATVKRSPPPSADSININLGTFRDGTFSMTNVTLNDTLKYAHELVRDEQLSGPTGLTGAYAVKLDWAPDTSLAPVIPDAPPPGRPNLFEAVQQQLGLKLESRRSPLDVLVVTQASQVPEDN